MLYYIELKLLSYDISKSFIIFFFNFLYKNMMILFAYFCDPVSL